MSQTSSQISNALLLDPAGDAPVPTGYMVVDTDVAWLRVAAQVKTHVIAPKIIIRGVDRCNWAYKWWQALGGQTETCTSPTMQLMELCPSLSEIQARQVLADLSTATTAKLPTLEVLLEELYPSFSPHWQELPLHPAATELSKHAAHWLSWLAAQPSTFPAHQLPLVKTVLAAWYLSFPDAAALFPTSPAEAQTILTTWIGYEAPTASSSLAPALAWAKQFPLPVTSWMANAYSAFNQQVVGILSGAPVNAQDQVALSWWQLQTSKAQRPEIRLVALNVLVQQLQSPAFTQAATERLVSELERSSVATNSIVTTLRKLVPPPVPPYPPTEPSSVLQWVTQYYLPYRLWQASHNSNLEAKDKVQKLAEAFSDWFLETYPLKLVGKPAHYQQQYWAKGALQKPSSDEIVLWVIADGLGWGDALTLQQNILNQAAGRLSLAAATPCFGLVPTITSHTKRAVRWAVPLEFTEAAKTKYFAQQPAPPADIRGIDNLAEAVQTAQAGQVLVWQPPQPDSIYHNPGSAQTIRNQAKGSLAGLADSICEAVASVPTNTSVRVLITTDHGRLLSESPRILEPISGFTGHGRAAFRATPPTIKPIPRPEEAVDTDSVRWLDPDPYKLPDWVAIARSDASFKIVNHTGNMRGGTDIFPHGGAWPEEVVVPWIELQSNLAAFLVGGSLIGESRSNRPGKAELSLVNSSSRPGRLRKIEIDIPRLEGLVIEFDELLPGLNKLKKTVELPRWPDTAQAEKTIVTAIFETPDGELHSFVLTADLRNNDLRQTSSNPLDDLI
ncbi:hypothetical protein [Adhaeribacter rhizoryzae]|uniref:PglZ domain-containing protein n=1 Tax=Adhaeribacter rhizoryzae TaxID=2607907 RepID=A0A5M6DSF9_9BACT|nr:hypothetical protein [Adhaeribacter rhizoryzae]KAA5548345.1 hypothetical protein F0145_06365 [Adhaeribacter rhizoryzae]